MVQILSSYFVVLPLRDEGAISLGVSNLPILFVGSLVLTLVAVPLSTLLFSLPSLPKVKVSCLTFLQFYSHFCIEIVVNYSLVGSVGVGFDTQVF